jgi:hypothetical protein
MAKNGRMAKRKKRSDLRFYCIMIAFPLLQFIIMWMGVNINSILLAFKEINVDYTYKWSLHQFTQVIKDLTTDTAVRDGLINSTIFWFCTNIQDGVVPAVGDFGDGNSNRYLSAV